VSQTEQTVRQRFQQYYLSPEAQPTLPPRMKEREYGFLLFKEKFMVRHRSFKSQEALLLAIRDLVPAHVYFSTAYYLNPSAPMDEKGWQGADLVFDVDADHLDTPCKPNHDSWKCKACKTAGTGSTPKVCPKCKNDRFEEQTWLCEKCLQQAKEETINFSEMFFRDFSPDRADVQFYFSGHRGYHMHVHSDELLALGEQERREIVDYFLGLDLDPEFHGLGEIPVGPRVKVTQGPLIGELGWRGRIVEGIYDILSREGETFGLSPSEVETVRKWDRDNLFTRPFWSSLKGISVGTWKKIISRAVQAKSAKIDTVVTTDVHRLIRLPGTLNGHTGLRVVDIPPEKLDAFDPFAESPVFQGQMKIRVGDAPEFRLGDKHFGPYHDEMVELPAAAAMLLLCKRRGEPAA